MLQSLLRDHSITIKFEFEKSKLSLLIFSPLNCKLASNRQQGAFIESLLIKTTPIWTLTSEIYVCLYQSLHHFSLSVEFEHSDTKPCVHVYNSLFSLSIKSYYIRGGALLPVEKDLIFISVYGTSLSSFGDKDRVST